MLCLNVCSKSGLKSLSSQAAVVEEKKCRCSMDACLHWVRAAARKWGSCGARALQISVWEQEGMPCSDFFRESYSSLLPYVLLRNPSAVQRPTHCCQQCQWNICSIKRGRVHGYVGLFTPKHHAIHPLAKPNMTMLTSLFCCSASFLSPSSRHRLLRYRITNVGGADPFWLSQLSGHRCTYHSNHSTTFLTHCKADRAVPKLPWLQHIFKSWPLLQFINYRPGRRPPHLHKLLL